MLIETGRKLRRDGVLFEGDWLPLVGLPVVEAKAMLKDAGNISYFADAIVNGGQVPVAHVLRSGDRLEFAQRFGVKAGDDLDAERAMAEALLRAEPELARLVVDVSRLPLDADEMLAVMALRFFQWCAKRFGPVMDDAVAMLKKIAGELSRLANGGALPPAEHPERTPISYRVRVDLAAKEVVIDGHHYALDDFYLAILACLVTAGGAVVSAPEMREQSQLLKDEERIDRLIAKLKRDHEKVGYLIESVPGKGYRIVMLD